MLDHVRGRSTGLTIPAHAEALRVDGVAFLTAAFRTSGLLPADRAVARITRLEPCVIGSTGEKLFLSVAYDPPDPALPTDFFVKFSRHFGDPFFDRRRFELESEIRLCALARKPGFPIDVPVSWFGDFDPESGTGILITELIAFGRDGIEPLLAKCMDHEMARPLDHYRAIVVALARLAAADHAGALSPEVEALFPFDAQAAATEDPIPWDEAGLRAAVGRYAAMAAQAPQLFPAELRTPAFIATLERNVLTIARHQEAIRRHLHADPAYVALGHFNPNVDNAWFRRDADGGLACGLFDWQRARQMNVAYGLWGGLCAAGHDIWIEHRGELFALFAHEVAAHGGPLLDPDTIALDVHLYAATMGTAGMLDAPAVIRSRLPGIVSASGPRDPALLANEGARCFLHVFTSYLLLWHLDDFGTRLDEWLDRIGVAPAGGAG